MILPDFAGIAILAICALLTLIMSIFFLLKSKKGPLLYSYLWCQTNIFIWCVSQILESTANTLPERWFYAKIAYIAIAFVGVCWLLFCLFYTKNKFLKKQLNVASLFIPPIIFYVFMITSNYHNLFYVVYDPIGKGISYGIVFWMHVLVTYSYIIAGLYILIKHSIKQLEIRRKQSVLLVLAVLVPFLSNMLILFHIITGIQLIKTRLDITPIGFAFSLLFFSIAVFKYRFLNIVPLATKRIVESMKEAVIVIDSFNNISSYNKSFAKMFPEFEKDTDENPLEILAQIIAGKSQNKKESRDLFKKIVNNPKKEFSGEITIDSPEFKSFLVNVKIINGKNDEFMGSIVTFNDITSYKKLTDKLNDKNTELKSVNKQLIDYSEKVEELAVIKERNRFARDAHDTLGHTMTVLISLLEVSNMTIKTNPEGAEQKINEALKMAREGLRELRISISGLKAKGHEKDNFADSLKKLVEDFKSTGVKVDLTIENSEVVNKSNISNVLYRVCQEGLTNALRHGKATQVSIIFKYAIEKILLYIFDNGKGCKEIKKGNGLRGMEERVKSINGTMSCGSDGENGFNIKVELPAGGVEND